MEKREPSYTVGGNANYYNHYGSQCGDSLKKKLKTDLPYDPAIPLLGIPIENELKETHVTPMFVIALFTIAKTWNQPRCSSADEWIRKWWYICPTEYFSAIKKIAVESVLIRCMKLEPIIQSDISQKEKHQYSILTHIYGI